MPLSPYAAIIKKFNRRRVRYVVIGVSAINFYADNPGAMIATQDFDILVEPRAANVLSALKILEADRFRLESNGELLAGIDMYLAKKMVEHRAVVTATKDAAARIDLVIDAGGIPFQEWRENRRMFKMEGVPVAVGDAVRLMRAKENANREKDQKFLALYKIQLAEMLRRAKKSK